MTGYIVSSGNFTSATISSGHEAYVTGSFNGTILAGGLATGPGNLGSANVFGEISGMSNSLYATVNVESGGLAVDLTLTDYGQEQVVRLNILSGGTASAITVTDPLVRIENRGLEIGLDAYGDYDEIGSGGVEVGAKLRGAQVTVDSGGLLSGATLLNQGNWSGAITVNGGRVINGVISGGTEYVAAGADSGSVVSSGGTILGYGEFTDLTVLSGGTFSAYLGAHVSGLTVSSGGHAYVSGSATFADSVVESGAVFYAQLEVLSGQVLTTPLASESPFSGLTLESGAVLSFTSVIVDSGGVLSGGTGSGPAIGVIVVDQGAIATGDLRSQVVEAIGEISGAIVGRIVTLSGAQVLDVTMVSSSILSVNPGTLFSGVTLSAAGAWLFVQSGGHASDVDVVQGKLELISGASVSDVTLEQAGSALISSGTTVDGLTVLSGGLATIMLGGEVSDLDVQAGAVLDMRMSQGILSASVADGQFVLFNDGTTANAISLTPGGADFHLSLSDDGQNGVLVDVTSKSRNDFDGDGTSELLVQDQASGAVYAIGQNLSGEQNLGGLGPEWSFRGTGDYLGHARTDYLIQNASGALVVGELNDGQMDFTTVGGLGSSWSFRGTGDFLGDRQDQVLLQNDNGAVVLGEVVDGQMAYNDITALGADWHFRGTGDFLGDGHTSFLLQNDSGLLVTGEVAGGQVTYSTIGAVGGEWTIKETGAFLDDGKDDVLMQNSSGALVVGEVTGGQASYTTVGALGSEWAFVGALDPSAGGPASFLIQNTAGAVVKGTVVAGQAQYAFYDALGSNWTFHG